VNRRGTGPSKLSLSNRFVVRGHSAKSTVATASLYYENIKIYLRKYLQIIPLPLHFRKFPVWISRIFFPSKEFYYSPPPLWTPSLCFCCFCFLILNCLCLVVRNRKCLRSGFSLDCNQSACIYRVTFVFIFYFFSKKFFLISGFTQKYSKSFFKNFSCSTWRVVLL
jgi:hypothetical protein